MKSPPTPSLWRGAATLFRPLQVQFTGETLFDGATVLPDAGKWRWRLDAIGRRADLGQSGLNNRVCCRLGIRPAWCRSIDLGILIRYRLVEIGGLLAGTEHDLLIVGGGQTFLDGFIEVI